MRSMKYLILLFWFFERKMLELSNFYSAAFFWDVCIIILLSQNFVRLVFVHAFFVSRSSFCFSFKKNVCIGGYMHALGMGDVSFAIVHAARPISISPPRVPCTADRRVYQHGGTRVVLYHPRGRDVYRCCTRVAA